MSEKLKTVKNMTGVVDKILESFIYKDEYVSDQTIGDPTILAFLLNKQRIIIHQYGDEYQIVPVEYEDRESYKLLSKVSSTIFSDPDSSYCIYVPETFTESVEDILKIKETIIDWFYKQDQVSKNTFQDLSNIDWVKINISNNSNKQQLLACISLTNQVKNLLDERSEFYNFNYNFFKTERQKLAGAFAKELGLGFDEDLEWQARKYPTFKARFEELEARQDAALAQLFSKEEKQKIHYIFNNFKKHINVVPIRNIITLKNIIKYSFDEIAMLQEEDEVEAPTSKDV